MEETDEKNVWFGGEFSYFQSKIFNDQLFLFMYSHFHSPFIYFPI